MKLQNKIKIFAMRDMIERVTFKVPMRTTSIATTVEKYEEDTELITLATKDIELEVALAWWVYVILAICVFLICLLLNYLVKKLNDARLEERFIRLYQKNSTSTQVQGALIEIERRKKSPSNNTKYPQNNIGISMIFNKEENRNAKPLTSSFKIKDNPEDLLHYSNSKAKYIDTIYNNGKFTSKESIGKRLSDQTIAKYLDNCRDNLSKSNESKNSITNKIPSNEVLRMTSTNKMNHLNNGKPKSRQLSHQITDISPLKNSKNALTKTDSSKLSLKIKISESQIGGDYDTFTKSEFLDGDKNVSKLPSLNATKRISTEMPTGNNAKLETSVEKLVANIDEKAKPHNMIIINSSSTTKGIFDALNDVLFDSSKITLKPNLSEVPTATNSAEPDGKNWEQNDTEVDSIYKKMTEDSKSQVLYFNTSSDETKIVPYDYMCNLPADYDGNSSRATNKMIIKSSTAQIDNNKVNNFDTKRNTYAEIQSGEIVEPDFNEHIPEPYDKNNKTTNDKNE